MDALTIAVRMAGDLQENIGEDVRRACDEPAATAPVVNAIFDDRNDQRTSDAPAPSARKSAGHSPC